MVVCSTIIFTYSIFAISASWFIEYLDRQKWNQRPFNSIFLYFTRQREGHGGKKLPTLEGGISETIRPPIQYKGETCFSRKI